MNRLSSLNSFLLNSKFLGSIFILFIIINGFLVYKLFSTPTKNVIILNNSKVFQIGYQPSKEFNQLMKKLYDVKPKGSSLNHIKRLQVIAFTRLPVPNSNIAINTFIDIHLSQKDTLVMWLQIDPTKVDSIRSNFNELIFTSLMNKALSSGQITQQQLEVLKPDISKLSKDSPFTYQLRSEKK